MDAITGVLALQLTWQAKFAPGGNWELFDREMYLLLRSSVHTIVSYEEILALWSSNIDEEDLMNIYEHWVKDTTLGRLKNGVDTLYSVRIP